MRSPFGAQQQHFEGDFEKNVKRTFSSTLIGEGLFFNETCFQRKHFLTILCCGCTFTVFHLTYFCWVIVAFTFQKTQFFRTFFVIITSLVISVCPAARCWHEIEPHPRSTAASAWGCTHYCVWSLSLHKKPATHCAPPLWTAGEVGWKTERSQNKIYHTDGRGEALQHCLLHLFPWSPVKVQFWQCGILSGGQEASRMW